MAGIRRLPATIAAAAMLLWSLTAAGDGAIRVVIEPWPPYADEDLPGQGFLAELTVSAFEAAGYEPEVEFIPWARALHDVEQGYRDVLMGLFYSDERNEVYWYSDVVYETQVGLIVRSDFPVERYDSLDDLGEFTIGIGRGFANSPEFDQAVADGRLDVDVATDHAIHIRMLFADRIDMLAGTVDIIMHLAQEAGYSPEDMVMLQPPLMTHPIHIGVSRAIEDGEQIRDDFNRGLEIIRRNGTYDEIMARSHSAN